MLNAQLPIVTYGSPTGSEEISLALSKWGFFYLQIPDEILCLIHSLLDDGRDFFELSSEEKRGILMKKLRGYSELGSEITRGKRDWHECLDFGTEDKGRNFFNLYPQRPQSLKETVEKALTLIPEKIGFWVLECIEKGLKMDKGTLTTPGYFALLRLLHYPHMEESQDTNIGIGVGEHTDYGFLTFVYSLQKGLEVRLPGKDDEKWGDWVSVPVMKNCFVCNIGDSLSKLTRNVLRATPHRVTYPPKDGPSRVSVAIFCEPHLDRIIIPLKNNENGNKNENEDDKPYVYGDYLLSKYSMSYPSL